MREESPREKRLSIPSMGVLQIPSENKTHTTLKVKYHWSEFPVLRPWFKQIKYYSPDVSEDGDCVPPL